MPECGDFAGARPLLERIADWNRPACRTPAAFPEHWDLEDVDGWPPGKIRMPLLKYFSVMGSVLVGILLVASAMMTNPGHPIYLSKFDTDRLAVRHKPAVKVALPEVKILAARPAPEPPHIAMVPSAPAVAAAAPPPAPVKVVKAEVTKKKKTHVAQNRAVRRHAKRQWYDEQDFRYAEREPPSREQRWREQPWDDFAYAPRQQNFWFR
jgi:hypothetical protein